MRPPARLLLTGLLLAALPALAAEAGDEPRLSVHGFGGVATGLSSSNPYLAASPGLGGHYLHAGLLARAQPLEPLALHVFPFFEVEDGRVRTDLDWAFAEWTFSDALRLRAGRSALPLGLYTETSDIGTLRPFFFLPQGLYGPTELGAESYDGVGLTGRLALPGGAWSLAYDAYAGFLTLETRDPYDLFEGDGEDLPVSSRVLGGRLLVGTPVDGLQVFGAGYLAHGSERGARVQPLPGEPAAPPDLEWVVGGGAEWVADALTVRAETFVHTGEAEALASGYLELAYDLTEHWQVAGRAELARERAEAVPADDPLLRHTALALGLNHWFSRQLVVKGSYQFVEGNRFAYPDNVEAVAAAGALAPRTHLLTLGAQFSF